MKGWIPPVPLALGALFGALSWVLVLLYGIVPSFGLAVAWIHLFALASITTIALSVLIHVVPGFTDLRWRAERIARWSGNLLPWTAAALALSFAASAAGGVAIFGIASAIAVVAFAIVAIVTLVQRPADPTDAAIARAFLLVMVFLAIAGVLGGLLAYGYDRGDVRFLRLAPEHAGVAIVGWLTLLTMGVSARTFRPILGSEPRWRPMHVASNSLMLLGAVAIPLAIGVGSATIVRIAFAVALVAAIAYASDGADRVWRARTPNRPAHAFVLAALVWLVFSASAAVAGAYDVAVAGALAGWLGQMVNAHLHHIGIRVIATTFAGDDNETRPWVLTDARLSWTTVIFSQAAVLSLLTGIASARGIAFVFAGVLGLLGAAAFAANAALAAKRSIVRHTSLQAR